MVLFIYKVVKEMKLNNKGFTLIEIIVTVSILSIMFVSLAIMASSTLSITDTQAYDIMKKSIITQANDYIIECENNLLDCTNDFRWIEQGNSKSTSFNVSVLTKYGYFTKDEYINPITNEDISDCLVINVTKDNNGNIDVDLDDADCQ